MSITAHFMNMIPYMSGEANPLGGFDFQRVSGVKAISLGDEVTIDMAFQFAVLDPIGATYLWQKIEVEYQGEIIAQSVEQIDGGRYAHSLFDVWGWTYQIEFTVKRMGLYKVFLYLSDSAAQPFDQCHATFSFVMVGKSEGNIIPQ